VIVSSSQATSQSLPISVLDLIPTRAGEPASSAIAQSVELARHVEQLGYKRCWVAGHHSIQGLVCSATPILIEHIFVFVGSQVRSRRLCSLVESDGQSGSYFRGADNEMGPEVGFEEICRMQLNHRGDLSNATESQRSDLLEARFWPTGKH
jgi:hypothetical protein